MRCLIARRWEREWSDENTKLHMFSGTTGRDIPVEVSQKSSMSLAKGVIWRLEACGLAIRSCRSESVCCTSAIRWKSMTGVVF